MQDIATIGLTVSGADKKLIDRVTIRRAGLLGIGGNQIDNSVISNSVFSDNNTEGFKDEPVSGGHEDHLGAHHHASTTWTPTTTSAPASGATCPPTT